MVNIELLGDIAEMKRIYASIDQVTSDSESTAVIISSATPREGKTILSAGLAALTARQSGRQTLAVDMNWFSPALHSCFGLSQKFSLSDLSNGSDIHDLIEPSGVENLDILTAPNLNDNQDENSRYGFFLGTDIIRKMRAEYGFVIIDSSSVFPTNRQMMDPVALSSVTDGVILVVLANVTPRQKAKHAKMILETSGANVLGAVVNQGTVG